MHTSDNSGNKNLTSDASQSPSTNWWHKYEEERLRRSQLLKSLLPGNKAALFDELRKAGITSITVTFDGYGDSGQIEQTIASAGQNQTALPNASITLLTPKDDVSGYDSQTATVADAVEELVYLLLEDTWDGWEINDGSEGTFVFDVASEAISLEFNKRFSDVRTSEHRW